MFFIILFGFQELNKLWKRTTVMFPNPGTPCPTYYININYVYKCRLTSKRFRNSKFT